MSEQAQASGGRQPAEKPEVAAERDAPPPCPPGRTIGVWEYLILFQIVAATYMLVMRCVAVPWSAGRFEFQTARVVEALRESWHMTFGVNCWAVPLAWFGLSDSHSFRVNWVGDPPWKWAAIVAGVLAVLLACCGVVWTILLKLSDQSL